MPQVEFQGHRSTLCHIRGCCIRSHEFNFPEQFCFCYREPHVSFHILSLTRSLLVGTFSFFLQRQFFLRSLFCSCLFTVCHGISSRMSTNAAVARVLVSASVFPRQVQPRHASFLRLRTVGSLTCRVAVRRGARRVASSPRFERGARGNKSTHE